MNLETWKRRVFEADEVPDDAVLFKDVETCVKEVNRDRREVTIAYSAESVDRDGDIIRQKGIDLKAYRKNPVVLFAHGSRFGPAESQLPIARSMRLFRSEDNLKSFSVDRFVEADIHALGETVFRMLSGTPAFLNAASIGFLPLKVEERELEDEERERYWRPADFKKIEKLEHSIVPVPANADALRAAKSAGIDIIPIKAWAEGILDQDEKDPVLTREHLERCYRIADNGRKTFSVPEIPGEAEIAEDGDEKEDKGSTPGNPSGFSRADEGTAWSAPTLSSFGVTGPFEDLPASRRRRIAQHFAWAEKMPPTTFGQLKLPHHRANDAAVVLRGVNAALAVLNGARGGVNIPSEDRQPANSHLNGHRRAFGQEPIALRDMDDGEVRTLLEQFAREEMAIIDETVEAMAAIDDEVGKIVASLEAEPEKEEEVAEETTKTEEPTGKVSLGTIEVEVDVKEKVEADEVFDVSAKDAEPEEFDFPSIKDEEVATKDDQETQVAELRQGLRAITALVRKLVDAIKVTGSPEESEPEPEKKEEGDEAILVLADEPEKEEDPSEKVGRFIAEETAKAVASAVGRHTGRLPN